jgi:hypothetical protein
MRMLMLMMLMVVVEAPAPGEDRPGVEFLTLKGAFQVEMPSRSRWIK